MARVVELEIVRAVDQHGSEIVWEPLAWMRVAPGHASFHGDTRMFDLTVPLMSVRTGAEVRFNDDPEEWARSLPSAFRTGDIIVRILRDDRISANDAVLESRAPPNQPLLLKKNGMYTDAEVSFDLQRGKLWITFADGDALCVEAPRMRRMMLRYDEALAESGLVPFTEDGYER